MTKRILVIEDEPQMLLGLRDNLELEGYEVITAADGEEGLAFVVANATSRALQEACVAALVKKTEILWHLVDCVEAATA